MSGPASGGPGAGILMIRTNEDRLVMLSVQGLVTPPLRRQAMAVDRDGVPFVLPGIGGITYNVRVGDPAFGWVGDHVEPCASVSAVPDESRRDSRNRGLNILACVGNTARVVSGDAKGAEGVVTGHHGGAENVLVDFPGEALEKLAIEDKVLIKSLGQGLKLLDYPGIFVYNLDPGLLHKMGVMQEDGRLKVPVVKKVPSGLMGSGIGEPDVASGDYDITTDDKGVIEELGLGVLRLGDLVALLDCDNRFGRSFRRGAVSIGVVVHADCLYAGHGPGVATLMSAVDGSIEPLLSPDANIGRYLGIGRYRPA